MNGYCHLVTGCSCGCGFRKRGATVTATSGDAIRAKMQAGEEALLGGMAQTPEEKARVVERRIDGLIRENDRLAQQAHELNHQLNRTEKELHEAKLAVGHAMNFAILLAKSIK